MIETIKTTRDCDLGIAMLATAPIAEMNNELRKLLAVQSKNLGLSYTDVSRGRP